MVCRNTHGWRSGWADVPSVNWQGVAYGPARYRRSPQRFERIRPPPPGDDKWDLAISSRLVLETGVILCQIRGNPFDLTDRTPTQQPWALSLNFDFAAVKSTVQIHLPRLSL